MEKVSNMFARTEARFSAGRYKAYVRLFSGVAPYFLVNEFPKSGGTWLAQMLSDALDLPFRRNCPVRFERSITHGHFLSPLGLRNLVVLWRDPRDIMISLYYHCFFKNELNNRALVDFMKKRLAFKNYHDVRGNLPKFIRSMSTMPMAPRFTWPEFANVWTGHRRAVHISYEELRRDTQGALSEVVYRLSGQVLSHCNVEMIVERHSFTRARSRADAAAGPGVESSFVREGSVGGWRKYFSSAAEEEMQGAYIEPMRRLGYHPFA